jgi:hypothetical protein
VLYKNQYQDNKLAKIKNKVSLLRTWKLLLETDMQIGFTKKGFHTKGMKFHCSKIKKQNLLALILILFTKFKF